MLPCPGVLDPVVSAISLRTAVENPHGWMESLALATGGGCEAPEPDEKEESE